MERLTRITPTHRRYLYRVTQALLALLAIYGILDAPLVAVWATLAAAIFEVPIANVPQEDT